PGGHVEQNETVEDAVVREIKEETNLYIQPKFLFYHDEIFPEENWHAVVLVFHAAANGTVKLNEESTEYRWFAPEEALKMELGFSHEKVISRWIGSRA
ncbi:NUDIX domain-containing protein, partial [archaeon]